MKDRIAQNPNRYTVTPVDGSAAYDVVITRNDAPLENGTPFNTAAILKDVTAAQFGLTSDAVPDEVFAAIATSLGSLSDLGTLAKEDIAPTNMGGTGAATVNAARRNLGFTPVRLYSGTLSVGGSATVATLAQYVCFLVVSQNAYIVCFRTNNSIKGSGLSADEVFNGMAMVAFTLDVQATTNLVLSYCKRNQLTDGNFSRTDSTITEVWGIF